MSAVSHLAQFGVSIEQARAYLMANLDKPLDIFSTAHQFGITCEMLAEIVGSVDTSAVRSWFIDRGFNPNTLDGTPNPFIPADMQALVSLVSLNAETGILSNSALHAAIVKQAGADAFNEVFSPGNYDGSEDGFFSGVELGLASQANLPATQETLESLYFGTAIKIFRSIDLAEIENELMPFLRLNQEALAIGNPAVTEQYSTLLIGILKDNATQPLFSEQQIAEAIVAGGIDFVSLASSGNSANIFSSLLGNLLTN